MKRGNFSLEDGPMQVFDDEAAEKGLSRDGYASQIIEQRHSKEIVIKSDDVRMQARLEAIIETLRAQVADLTDRLSQASRQEALAGVETQKGLTAKDLKAHEAQLLEKWTTQQDLARYAELKEKHKEVEAELAQLRESDRSAKNWEQVIEAGKGVAMSVANNPQVQARLAGLMGIDIDPSAAPLGALPEADQQALETGRVFMALDPAIQGEFGIVLGVLADQPALMAHIMKIKPFAQAKTQAMAQ
jgi:hypothetical protein